MTKSFHATLAEFRDESRVAKRQNEKAIHAFALEEERKRANFSSQIKQRWKNAIKKVIFRNSVDKV